MSLEISSNAGLDMDFSLETKNFKQQIETTIPDEVKELAKGSWGHRNEKKQEYKYFYIFNDVQGKRDVWVYLKNNLNTISVTIEALNTFWIKKGTIQFEIDKNKKSDIPNKVVEALQNGIEMEAFTGKESLKVMDERRLTRVSEKAKKAIIVFDHYTKKSGD